MPKASKVTSQESLSLSLQLLSLTISCFAWSPLPVRGYKVPEKILSNGLKLFDWNPFIKARVIAQPAHFGVGLLPIEFEDSFYLVSFIS